MTIYYIEPKPEFANSHRWFVDDEGLEFVKKHYETNYDSKYLNKKFIIKNCDFVMVDFGGMCLVNEPTVSVIVDGVEFKILKMHIGYFKTALIDRTTNKNLLKVKIWHWNHVYSANTCKKILDAINALPDINVNLN